MRLLVRAFLLSLALAGPGHAETRVPATQAEIALSFAPVVRAAAPAVVNIHARLRVERASPFADDPFFGPLFREFGRDLGRGPPRLENSLGSGVILSADGFVVSNWHVVADAVDIRVVLADRREYDAEIVLGDEESDLAILRLRGAEGLPALTLRDSDGVEVGELVLAIGNPFGVGQTVTSGIVSGLARSGAATGSARGWFIQTDAAINPGNSGGALVDMNGQLVGINTAILTRSGGSHGIGFAIPSKLVARFLDLARAGETRLVRPWAGIAGQTVTADLAEGLGMPAPEGFLLSALHPASPFAQAGLRVGDVLVSVGGAAVHTPQDVSFRLSVAGPGAALPVEVLGRTGRRALTVVLTPPPDDPPADPVTIPEGYALAGLSVANVNPRMLAEHDLPLDARGVVVTGAAGPMARAGFRPGDLILAINGAPVATTRDVARAAQLRTRGWLVDLVRRGQPMQLRFRL